MQWNQKTRQFNPNYSTFTKEYFQRQEVQKKVFPVRKKKEYSLNIELDESSVRKEHSSRPKSEQKSKRKKRSYNDLLHRCQQTIERVRYSLNRMEMRKSSGKEEDEYDQPQLNVKISKPANETTRKPWHPLRSLIEKYQDLLNDGYDSLSIQMQSILDKHRFELNIEKRNTVQDEKRCQSSSIHQRSGKSYKSHMLETLIGKRVGEEKSRVKVRQIIKKKQLGVLNNSPLKSEDFAEEKGGLRSVENAFVIQRRRHKSVV